MSDVRGIRSFSGRPARQRRPVTARPIVLHRRRIRAEAAAFFDQPATRRARRLHFAAGRGHDTWDRLAEIAAPTLAVHGAGDAITPPANAAMMAAGIPDSQVVLLPDEATDTSSTTP